MSVKLAESTTGGKTWHVSGKGLHGDHHDLWIAANGRTIVEANDGGVGLSHDGGATWEWRNVLPIAQFYHVAYDLQTIRTTCAAACRTTARGARPCAPATTAASCSATGTRCRAATARGSCPTRAIRRRSGRPRAAATTRATSRASTGALASQFDVSPYLRDQNVVAPARLAYRFNWETPIAFAPFDRRAVYVGGNVVFRSTDDGMHWTAISPDLTRNLKERQGLSGGPLTLDVTGAETFDTILAVAPSPARAKTIWVATDDGVVQLTRDGGAHWRNVSIPGVDADGRIPNIEPSHRSAGTAYAVVDRHYVGDRAPYVYVTHDFGATWRAIASGLPQSEVHVVREDPRNPRLLYAGTGKGVWWSDDAGASWKPFPAPLPPVEVRDLAVQPVAGDLIAATHGRGMYVFDDLTALRDRASAQAAEARLFAPRAALPLQRYTPTVNARGGGEDAAPATFTFWQAAPAKTAPSLQIVDARGGSCAASKARTTRAARTSPTSPTSRATTASSGASTRTRRCRGAASRRGTAAPTPACRCSAERTPCGCCATARRTRRRSSCCATGASRPRADELRGYRFQTAMYAELSALDDALNALDNVRVQLPDRIAGDQRRRARRPCARRARRSEARRRHDQLAAGQRPGRRLPRRPAARARADVHRRPVARYADRRADRRRRRAAARRRGRARGLPRVRRRRRCGR